MQQTTTYTQNGAIQLATTLSKCLDLFAEIGSARKLAHDNPTALEDMFVDAYAEDPETALSILFWSRAIREGSGERDVFFRLIGTVADIDKDIVLDNLPVLPEIGRWKDLVQLYDMFDFCRNDIAGLFADAIEEGSYHAAKWLPKKHALYSEVRQRLHYTNKEFRKCIKRLAPTVEQKLCAKKISEIEYDKLPSVALNRYTRLFMQKDRERFIKVTNAKGVNASVVYPHDVLGIPYKCGIVDEGMKSVVQAQWDALPDYLHGRQVLTVLDTSASMTLNLPNTYRMSMMDIAASLAVYCAERTCPPFRDKVISFSSNAMFFDLAECKCAYDKYDSLMQHRIVDTTNIESVFDLILRTARKANLPESEMPECILILSDMQFDVGASNNSVGFMDSMRFKFRKHGYRLPSIIYWNLNATNMGVHGDKNDNIAFVSGYSPAVLKAVCAGDVADKLSPMGIMNTAIAPLRKKLSFHHAKRLPGVITRRNLNPTRGSAWTNV